MDSMERVVEDIIATAGNATATCPTSTTVPQSHPGKFSLGVTNDPSSEHIFITVGVPKIVDLPYVGPTTIETICIATAACLVPCVVWYGRRTYRRFKQYIKDKKHEREEKRREAELPVKGKKWDWDSKSQLDEFMDKQIAPVREKLRKVEDPDTAERRKAKRDRIKKEHKKKPKGKLGLTDDLLQGTRTSLRQSKEASLASLVEEDKEKGREKHAKKVEGKLGLADDLLQGTRTNLRQSTESSLASLVEEDKEKSRNQISTDGESCSSSGNESLVPPAKDSDKTDFDIIEKPQIGNLDGIRRAELKRVMKNKTLSKEERRLKIEEVNEKYASDVKELNHENEGNEKGCVIS